MDDADVDVVFVRRNREIVVPTTTVFLDANNVGVYTIGT